MLKKVGMWFIPDGFEVSNAKIGDKIKRGNTIRVSKEEAEEIYLEFKRLKEEEKK